MKKIRRKTIEFLYFILFNYLDQEKVHLFAKLNKMKSKTYNQLFFSKMHYCCLEGMNYINNDPVTNGEYFMINQIAAEFKSKGNVIIFDCGSNVGEYAKHLANSFENASIHCFEPSLDTFHELKANTTNFKGIIYNNIGIGETEKSITLHKNSEISALASIYKRDLSHINIRLDLEETIKITTLDEYCMINRIDKIDFLKLDVEGNEYNAFLGATKLISEKRIRYIQFEMGGCNIDSKIFWKDIYSLLSPHYNLYRIISDGLFELKIYEESMEIFVYSNFFAALK